ncbi:hypothetical protein ADK18_01000 [Bacillus anthracis]|nr:hypothetical protein ADK18_01000 [Bacillus anthracis]
MVKGRVIPYTGDREFITHLGRDDYD